MFMKYLTYTLLASMLVPLLGFAQGRSVAISSVNIILESVDSGFDLEASGKWFIQFSQDDWIKHGKTLYPDKTDRTRAVIDS